jgi:hypothetical protein
MVGRFVRALVVVPLLLLAGCKGEPQPKIQGPEDPRLQPAAVGGPGKQAPQPKPQ